MVVLSENHGPARYDSRAAAYDSVVGSAAYNRLAWGASTARFRAFAARAINSGVGPLLDAGCGSAVFTAQIYVRAKRPAVLVDRSVSMLQTARDRLRQTAEGLMPDHVVLLQADALQLPFRPGSFETVLAMGMLHLFEDPHARDFLRSLLRLTVSGGNLFVTSLVAQRAIGRCYLALLHRAGEVATPRSCEHLAEMLRVEFGEAVECECEGSMAYAAAQAIKEVVAGPARAAE